MALRRGRPTYRAYLLLLVVTCASCLFVGQHHAAEQGNRPPKAAVTGLVKDVSALPFVTSRIGTDDAAKKFGVLGDVPPGAPLLLVTATVVLVAAAINHRLRLGALASRAPPAGAAFS